MKALYVHLYTHFGFKKLFGEETNKNLQGIQCSRRYTFMEGMRKGRAESKIEGKMR